MKPSRCSIFSVAATLGLLAPLACADTLTWTNAAGGSWSTLGNWSGGSLPTTTSDTADFSTLNITAGTTVTLDGNQDINKLLFADATTASHDWTIAAGAPSTSTLTLGGSAPEISVTNRTATISAELAGSDNWTKTGAGTLTLSGANTYTGTTAVNAGVLNIQHATALGTSAGGTTVAAGAVLQIQGGITVAGESLTLTGDGSANAMFVNVSGANVWTGSVSVDPAGSNPRIGIASGSTLELSGGVNTTLSLSFQDNGTATVSGIVSGGGSIVRSAFGTGLLVLSGENTYTGRTHAWGGTLSAATLNSVSGGTASSNLGAPTTVANGTIDLGFASLTGTLRYTGNGETTDRVLNLKGTTGGGTVEQAGTGLLKFTSNLTATDSGAKTFTLSGSTAGTGEIAGAIVNSADGATSLTKSGTGTWTLSGTNTYTGATTVSAGTLQAGAAASGQAFGNGSAVTLANVSGATLDLNNFAQTIGSLAGGGTTGGNVTLGSGTLTTGGNNTSTSYAGVISGSGGLTKNGSGTQTLTGASTYTGATQINAGVLNIRHATALGTSAAGTTVAAGASLQIQGGITIVGESLSLVGDGSGISSLANISGNNAWTGNVTASGTLPRIDLAASSSLVFSGAVNLGSDLAFQNDGNATVSGVASGTGGIRRGVIGTGTLTLSGANTYTGVTSINGGVISAASLNSVTTNAGLGTTHSASSSLGAPTSITNGTIAVGLTTSAGTLRYTGSGETTDRVLNLAGTTGGGTVEQAGTGHLKFTSNLTATGSGVKTLTLSGSTAGTGEIAGVIVNSSGGATSVTKSGTGTWTLSGINTYSGTTTVDGGKLAITGAGSIDNSSRIHINTFATLDVADITRGTFTLGPAQTLSGGGTVLATDKTLLVRGTIAAGSSPGTLIQEGGVMQLDGGGDYNWEVLNASGVAGIGYDTVSLINGAALDLSLLSAGNTFNINLWSLSGIGPDVNGDALNFDSSQVYSWTLFSTGTAISGFSTDKFTININAFNGTSGFSNNLGGGFFSIGLADGDTDLVLNFTAVPEPGTALLSAFGLLALMRRRR
jgi:autotransporter-associated beta strand protein